MNSTALTSLVLTCALVGSGCGFGSWSNDDIAFYNALNSIPKEADLQAKVPSGTAGGLSGEGTRRDGLGDPVLGARSGIFADAKKASTDFNGILSFVLGTVDRIRSLAPTSRTANSRTWGPWDDPGNPGFQFRLVISRVDETNFGYAFQHRPKGGDFFDSVTGVFKATATAAKGSGTLTIHAATLAAQLPNALWAKPLEKIEMGYVTDAFPITVLMRLTAKAGEPVQSLDYGYQENENKSGGMGFKAFTSDPRFTQLDTGTAWLPSGAGYGVLTVIEGTYKGATQLECWDAAFNVVYAKQSWLGGVEVGDPASCVKIPSILP